MTQATCEGILNDANLCQQILNTPVDKNFCLSVLQDGTVSNASYADTVLENASDPIVRAPILPHASAIIAYDYNTGAVKWAHPLEGFDVWNAACLEPVPFLPPGFISNFSTLCPLDLRDEFWGLQFSLKDRDVANPILIEDVDINGEKRDIVLGMTKGTTLGAFDAETGEVIWMNPNMFGPGGISGDGFIFGKTTDGKRFYGNTGSSSTLTLAQYNDPANPAKVVPGTCDVSGPGTGFDPTTGRWGAGMHVAVNLDDGSVAWQRCATAKAIDPVTRLPNGIINPARSTSAVSYANGIVYMPGASSRIPLSSNADDNIVAEILLLDAEDGTLLKTLTLGVPGFPESTAPNYQRPTLVGDKLYLGGGTKQYPGFIRPEQIYNRVLMYQLED